MHAVALAYGSAAPTAAEIREAAGVVSATASSANHLDITGLADSTLYTVYAVFRDASQNDTAVQSFSLSTEDETSPDVTSVTLG